MNANPLNGEVQATETSASYSEKLNFEPAFQEYFSIV